jgi:hypothetical protein
MPPSYHHPNDGMITASDLYALLDERYATCRQTEQYLESAAWDLLRKTVQEQGREATRALVTRWQTGARHEAVKHILEAFLHVSSPRDAVRSERL